MRRIIRRLAVALSVIGLLVGPAAAASKSPAEISAEIDTNLPDNTQGKITEAVVRATLKDIANAQVSLYYLVSTCGSSQWVRGFSSTGAPICSVPVPSDISGLLSGSYFSSSLLPAFVGDCTSTAGSVVLNCKAGGKSLAFTGTASKWPWQLNTDGTWTVLPPAWGEVPAVNAAPYSATGDGITSNTSAFAAMEAASDKAFYLPSGGAFLASNMMSLTKKYVGLGQITDGTPTCTSCNAAAGVWSRIATTPVGTQTTNKAYYPPYTFQGDTSHVFPEYFYVENGVGMGANVPYQHSLTTPHWRQFTNLTGGSGHITALASPVGVGATSMTVTSAAGLSIGQQYGFDDQVALNPLKDVFTISNIVGTTVTFSPATTASYTSGYSISNSKRTQTAYQVDMASFSGYGDHYVFSAPAITSNCTPLAGQTDVYKTCTTGWANGAVYSGQAGQYLQIDEWQIIDSGNDTAAIGRVLSLNRTNATGARGAAWGGYFLNSNGSQPINFGFSMSGKMKTGFDTVLADLTSNGNAAIQMAEQQRIYFDSTATSAYTSPQGLWGNTLGSSWIGYVTADSAVEIYAKGVAVAKFSATGISYFGSASVVPPAANDNSNLTPSTSWVLSNAANVGVSSVKSGTDKGLLYNNAGVLGNLATANGGVLVTNGSGVPSISTTLPNVAHGTPTSITLTNGTGLPISGITGLGTGVGTALAAAVTGSGGIMLAASPTTTGTFTAGNISMSGLLTVQGVNALATDGTNAYFKANAAGGMYFQPNGGVTELTVLSTGSTFVHGITAASITTSSTTLHTTSVALTNGAAANTGTLTNAPAAGNPTKWIPINDNGTTRYIPAW